MSIILTWWEDPRVKNDPEDYDGIAQVHMKSVSEIPQLVHNRPKRCTAISTERSAFRTRKDGTKTNDFKFIWEKNPPPGVTYHWDRRDK